MINATTKSGFAFHIEDDIFDDFETVELFAKVNKNPIYIADLAEKLLGVEQKEALKEHLRRDGKVRTSDFMNAIAEIEEAITDSKNS